MDWFKEFEEKIKDDKRLNNLKEEKFYGYIQINFQEGEIISFNKYQTIK